MTGDRPKVLVIGIGNVYRSDDGVGIVVARRLGERKPAGVKIIEESGEGTTLLSRWKDAQAVILVDAVHSGAPPGTIRRIDARVETIPARFFHCSSHAFSVAEAVELGRALNQLPQQLILYGIEGGHFSAGERLSVKVEQAVTAVVGRVLDEVHSLQESACDLPDSSKR
jgi:hydrogenase maturation protease